MQTASKQAPSADSFPTDIRSSQVGINFYLKIGIHASIKIFQTLYVIADPWRRSLDPELGAPIDMLHYVVFDCRVYVHIGSLRRVRELCRVG